MSDEQDSWFQSAFGLNIGGVADRIRSEAEEAAGKVQSAVQSVKTAVEGVLDDVVETVTDVAKKVAGAAGGGAGGGGAGGGGAGGGGSPKTAAPAGGGTGTFPLSGSVGRGGRNAPGDVKAVQKALGIGVDGDCGSKTIAAIEAFQRTIGQAKPDGRVDAGGATERALAGGGAAGGTSGGTRLEPSAATNSVTSGAWDLVTSGARAVGDLAEAGWDAAAGAGAKVVSGAAGAAAGVASAVGADDAAKDLRGVQATAESDSNRFFGNADREFAKAKGEVFGTEPPVPRVSGGDTPPPTERPNPPPGGGPPTDRPPPPTERPDRPPEGGPPTERNPILPLPPPPSFPFPLGGDVSDAFQGVADAASGIVGGVAGQLLQGAGDLLGKGSPLDDVSLGGGGLRLTLNNLSPEQIETAQQFLRAHNFEARATRGAGNSDDDYEPFLNGRPTSLPEVIVALKSAIPPLPLQDTTEGLRDLVNERFRQLVKQGKERAFEQLFLNPNRVPNAPVDVPREEATKALTKFLERVLKAQGGQRLRITDPVRAAGQALGRGLPKSDTKITSLLTKKDLPGRPADLAGAITKHLPDRVPQANVEALDGIPVKDTAAKPQSLVEILGEAFAKEVEGLIKVLPKEFQEKVRKAVKESVEKAITTAVKQAMSESQLSKEAQERIEQIVESVIKQPVR